MLRYGIMRAYPRAMLAISVVLASVAGSGCSPQPPESYTPGLGEIMTLQQMRHSKLWFAGHASHWDLAAYELKELREGFDDVVRFHPTHESTAVPLERLVPEMMDASIEELDEIVTAKDPKRFVAGFDELTKACNACHEVTHFGFNVVQRPSQNPYTNQVFQPQ